VRGGQSRKFGAENVGVLAEEARGAADVQSTCCTRTKAQILTPEEARGAADVQSTCCTGTKAQILTPEEARGAADVDDFEADVFAWQFLKLRELFYLCFCTSKASKLRDLASLN
jgi:hypothetical protein